MKVYNYLKAKTEDELVVKMAMLSLKSGKEFQYTPPTAKGGFWFTWYWVELNELPIARKVKADALLGKGEDE